MTTTIVIADDHILFRQGLAGLLREQPGWTVVGEAENGEAAVTLITTLKPDVAVIDVEMAGIGGIEAAQRIHEVSAGTKIVALWMYANAHYQNRMRRAGAYVRKSQPIQELVDTIRAVLAGEVYEAGGRTSPEPGPESRSARVDADALSDRERDVLRMLAEGKRTAVIADALGISHKSVETYRAQLRQKLGIADLSGLVRFAIRAGLVSRGFEAVSSLQKNTRTCGPARSGTTPLEDRGCPSADGRARRSLRPGGRPSSSTRHCARHVRNGQDRTWRTTHSTKSLTHA